VCVSTAKIFARVEAVRSSRSRLSYTSPKLPYWGIPNSGNRGGTEGKTWPGISEHRVRPFEQKRFIN